VTVPGSSIAASAGSSLLPGFEYAQAEVQSVTVNHAIAGSGPPLLLLHGYPENHLMWRHVAPALAEDHTVVVADLRGYGDSGKHAPDAAGLVYSKRWMARDQVGLMRQLGFAQFGLVGHDRGARVAHRLVLDHPGVVSRLAVRTDLVHDEESVAAGQKIDCPVLALWGTQAFVGRNYEPVSVWEQYASDVRGTALPTGHFLPEEAPNVVSAALRDFLS
jgi:pimeloyl-ACP methyl ester carboxylesterase